MKPVGYGTQRNWNNKVATKNNNYTTNSRNNEIFDEDQSSLGQGSSGRQASTRNARMEQSGSKKQNNSKSSRHGKLQAKFMA